MTQLTKVVDVDHGRVVPRVFALFDEMRLGKTKQVIDSVQVLFERGDVSKALVVCPASARVVWYDPDPTFGEIARHAWHDLPQVVAEYHQRPTKWTLGDVSGRHLQWVITNYEFIRSAQRRAKLQAWCDNRTVLVLDESSAVKNARAQQSRACYDLRRSCGWAWILNGTPISNSPLDAYGQCLVLDPAILGCKSYFHFRAQYAVMGGFLNKQVLGYQNLERLQTRMAPYVLRRLKTDCLDLPEKLSPVTLTVPLSEETWKAYRAMRDDMIVWLDRQATVRAVAPQGGIKVMRLSQITSGFVGGVEVDGPPDESDEDPNRPAWIPRVATTVVKKLEPREVGAEKLNLLLDWIGERLEAEPNLKLIVWCRFRPAVARLTRELAVRFPNVLLGTIWGGQRPEERASVLRLLKPKLAPSGPVIVTGTPSSGSMSIDLAAASVAVYESNDTSLKTRLQSEDRCHGPGSMGPVAYFDVIATGPKGQKTIDHTVVKALRERRDLATWTCSAWKRALTEE